MGNFCARLLCTALFAVMLSALGLPAQTPQSPAAKPDSSPSDAQLNKDMAAMLSRLDSVISQSNRNDVVSQTWANIRKALVQSRIRFSLGPDSGSDLVANGARYMPRESGVSTVLVSRDLVALWGQQDILVMSLVLNALVFAEGHFLEGESFIKAWQEPVQGFLYSMDALYVQALFCRDYGGVFPDAQAGYTGFLAGGINKDGLSSVSIQVLGIDQMLVMALIDLRSRLLAGLTAGEWFDRVESLVSEVEANMAAGLQQQIPALNGTLHSPDEIKAAAYIALVHGFTMTRYGALILKNQMDAFGILQARDFALRREELNRRLDVLSKQVSAMAPVALQWRMEFLKRLLP